MLQIFSFIYLLIIVLVGSENTYFIKNINDINTLLAFLSLTFLCITFILDQKKK